MSIIKKFDQFTKSKLNILKKYLGNNMELIENSMFILDELNETEFKGYTQSDYEDVDYFGILQELADENDWYNRWVYLMIDTCRSYRNGNTCGGEVVNEMCYHYYIGE